MQEINFFLETETELDIIKGEFTFLQFGIKDEDTDGNVAENIEEKKLKEWVSNTIKEYHISSEEILSSQWKLGE